MFCFVMEEDAIGRAQLAGVLTEEEAFTLERLADTGEQLPEWLHDAVEKLYLFLEPIQTIH